MAVVSSPAPKQNQTQQRNDKLKSSSKKRMISSPAKKRIASSPKRNSCPGIRVVGGRIYDSQNGKTCHQCRQKTMDFTAACMNQKKDKPCPIKFCHKCLLNRYGEKAEEVAKTGDWNCPKCRGICNCSFCMKKRGFQPTGQLAQTAKASGFSSVSEMLRVNGPESIGTEKVVKDADPEKETVVVSPRKRGKENSFDGKIDSNSQTVLSSANGVQKKSKKVGGEDLKETHKRSADDNLMVKVTSPPSDTSQSGKVRDDNSICKGSSLKEPSPHLDEKKPKKPKRDGLQNNSSLNEPSLHCDEKKPKKPKRDGLQKNSSLNEPSLHRDEKPKKPKRDGLQNKHDADVGNITVAKETSPRKPEFANNEARPKIYEDCQNEKKNNVNVLKESCDRSSGNEKGEEDNNCDADIPLPQGTELTTVAGVDIPPEDVGNAFQFLEFCAVFGKVLDLKKGQAECILRDIIQSRSVRRGKYSLTVQFLIHLLSFILKEQGERSPEFSPANGKNSWTHALRRCISESQDVAKSMDLDLLDEGPEMYESLSSSKKLKLLNFLCDEVLETVKVREWIEEQNAKSAEKAKDARDKVLAAKDKEKNLKRKMQDDIAKAIIAKDGAPLSIAEHEAIVSKIKCKVAEAHAELLDSQGLLSKNKRKCDAMRTEPILLDVNGCVYWRLKCCSDKSDILLQDVGSGNALALDEKWFTFDVDQKEKIEQHVSSLRRKRLRAQRLPLIACQDNEAQL